MIIALIAIAVALVIFSLARNSRRTRESQERVEKHVISQIPAPDGFSDCSAEVVRRIREGDQMGAILQFRKDTGTDDLAAAKKRVVALSDALRAGPTLGRPPVGLFGN